MGSREFLWIRSLCMGLQWHGFRMAFSTGHPGKLCWITMIYQSYLPSLNNGTNKVLNLNSSKPFLMKNVPSKFLGEKNHDCTTKTCIYCDFNPTWPQNIAHASFSKSIFFSKCLGLSRWTCRWCRQWSITMDASMVSKKMVWSLRFREHLKKSWIGLVLVMQQRNFVQGSTTELRHWLMPHLQANLDPRVVVLVDHTWKWTRTLWYTILFAPTTEETQRTQIDNNEMVEYQWLTAQELEEHAQQNFHWHHQPSRLWSVDKNPKTTTELLDFASRRIMNVIIPQHQSHVWKPRVSRNPFSLTPQCKNPKPIPISKERPFSFLNNNGIGRDKIVLTANKWAPFVVTFAEYVDLQSKPCANTSVQANYTNTLRWYIKINFCGFQGMECSISTSNYFKGFDKTLFSRSTKDLYQDLIYDIDLQHMCYWKGHPKHQHLAQNSFLTRTSNTIIPKTGTSSNRPFPHNTTFYVSAGYLDDFGILWPINGWMGKVKMYKLQILNMVMTKNMKIFWTVQWNTH